MEHSNTPPLVLPVLTHQNIMMFIDGKYKEREIVTLEGNDLSQEYDQGVHVAVENNERSTTYNVSQVQCVQWVEKLTPYWLQSRFINHD